MSLCHWPVLRRHLSPTKWVSYNLYTIWLFTYSDLKTIVVPKTVFGTLSALAAPVFHFPFYPSATDVLNRAPITMLWVWLNLLAIDISNQRRPGSVAEDHGNKPWRAIPSGRITPRQAAYLMQVVYVLAIVASWDFGGLPQCLALIVLGIWYNDLDGANGNCLVRGLLNGLGYVCFASGATEVAMGMPLFPYAGIPRSIDELVKTHRPDYLFFWKWIALLVLVITISAHMQDVPDQIGDDERGRKTIPLVIGDWPARVSIMVGMAVSSLLCLRFWGALHLAYILPLALTGLVSTRLWLWQTIKSDKKTYLLWNVWLTSIYTIPLVCAVTA